MSVFIPGFSGYQPPLAWKRWGLSGLLMLGWLGTLPAQSPQVAIETTVQALFDGMRSRDTAAVRALFHPQAQLFTSHRVGEEPVVEAGSLDAFLRALGQPAPDAWDERISNLRIHEDATLAQAWMDYAFYLGDQLHHRGVNAMTLVLTPEGWRILHITDTRYQP